MMPRFSPPTAMGFPRRRESDACSTDAKKASASRWTMALGIPSLSLALAYQCHHDSLDNQFCDGSQFGIARVLGPKVRLVLVGNVGFERAFPVNQGRDHVAIAWCLAVFHDHRVAVKNMPANHRIPAHFQGKGAGRGLYPQGG